MTADVTVNIAGIGPLVTLGIEDRKRSAEAPFFITYISHENGD